jgi:hypothetical protein
MDANFKQISGTDLVKTLSKGINSKLPLSELPYCPSHYGDYPVDDGGWMDRFSTPEGVVSALRSDVGLAKNFDHLENCGILSGSDRSLPSNYELGKTLPLFPFRYDAWGRFMREGRSLKYCPTPTEALALLKGEEVGLPEIPEELNYLMKGDFDLFLVLPSLESESPEMVSLFWGDPIERAIVDSAVDLGFNDMGLQFNTVMSTGYGQSAFCNLAERLSSQASGYVPWGIVKEGEEGYTFKLDSEDVKFFKGRPGDDILGRILPDLSKAWDSHPLSRSRPFLPGSLNFGGNQIGVSFDNSVEEAKANFDVWLNKDQDLDTERSIALDFDYTLNDSKPVAEWDNRIFNALLRRIDIAWSSALMQTGNYGTLNVIQGFLENADMGECKSPKEFFELLADSLECSRAEAIVAFKEQINSVLDFEKIRQDLSHSKGFEQTLATPMTVSYEVPVKALNQDLKNFHNRASFITQASMTSQTGEKDASISVDVVYPSGHEALRRGVRNTWKWPVIPGSSTQSVEKKTKSKKAAATRLTNVELKTYLNDIPLRNYALSLYLNKFEEDMDQNMIQFDMPVDEKVWGAIFRQVSRLKEISKAGLVGEHPSVGVAHLLGGRIVPMSRAGVLKDLVDEMDDPVKGMNAAEFRSRVYYTFKELENVQSSLISWGAPSDVFGIEASSRFVSGKPELNLEVQRWLLPLIGEEVVIPNLSKIYGSNGEPSGDLSGLLHELNVVLNHMVEYGEYPNEEQPPIVDGGDLVNSWKNLKDPKESFSALKKFAKYCPFGDQIGKPVVTGNVEYDTFMKFMASEDSWQDVDSYLECLNDFGYSITLNDVRVVDLAQALETRNNIKTSQNMRFELYRSFNHLAKLFKGNCIYALR